MALDDLARESVSQSTRDRLVAVYIGVLAVILAVCSLGGSNAEEDAMLKTIEASNTWAFFQAKNARRQALRLHVDEYEVMLKAQPDLTADGRTLIEQKIAEYRTQDAKLTNDAERNEGLDQLFDKGKLLETERDAALKRGPYFDYASALLQIAIVLASVAIISGGNALLVVSVLLGLAGSALTFGGFTLAFALPF